MNGQRFVTRFGVRKLFLAALALPVACSNSSQDQAVGSLSEALTATQIRVLGFEGTIGGSNGDWQAISGTVTSNTAHSEGQKSLSLAGSTSPSARSAALSTLGTIASTAGIDVRVPTSLQGQPWLGQVALTFHAPSAGVFNINAGATTLSGPVGTFRHYTIPIPPFVVTALNTHTYSDLKVTVQLTVPSPSGAFLVDALTLTSGGGGGGSGGSASGGTSGTGGTATGGTSTGGTSAAGGSGGSATGGSATGGSVGAGGAAGTGGVAGTGGAGTGGSGGSAGSGGTAGSTGTIVAEFFIDLPKDLEPPTVALGSYGNGGGLVINDGTRVVETSGAFSNVTSALTTVGTDLGVNTQVKDVYSTPNIFVRGSHIHGNVWTSGALQPSPQHTSVIDGTISQNVSLNPIRRLSWTVPFKTFSGDPIVIPQGGTLTLEPGGTRGIIVNGNAHLKLDQPGIYTLDGPLTMEPDSVLEIDNAAGQVELYVRQNFIYRGSIQKTNAANNVLIGVLGTGDQPIERRFNAILVAPHGNVQLATVTNGHQTSVYAKSILARPNTVITHAPFDPTAFCEEPRCDGLCPAVTGTKSCDEGQPCGSSDDCAVGLSCENGVCTGGGCTPDLDACTAACPCPPTGVCTTGAQCQQGLNCQGGICTPTSGPGEPCVTSADCDPGLVCPTNNGGCFNGAVTMSVCWPAHCEEGIDPAAGDCGTPDSP